VSTAYYAVFHDLAWRGAAALLREGEGWTPRAAQVSRWVAHTELRRLADAVTGAKSSPALALALETPSGSLVRVGDAFATLQDARHEADYEDFYDLNRAVAVSFVDTADEALSLTMSMDESGDESFGVFCRLMLGAAQAKVRSR
jgi:hypothetical protein